MIQQSHLWADIQRKPQFKKIPAPQGEAALFTTAKTQKQPQCPSTQEWIKKMWYIYTVEYYSAIKKNKIIPFAATQVELETLIPSEVRERQIPCDITYMWNLKYDANEPICKTETDSQAWKTDLWLPRKRGREWDGLLVWDQQM